MLLYPNAKLNLGLFVTAKRNDGFHDIETVFYPIPLCDVLEINPFPEGEKGTVDFRMTGIAVEGDPEENLVLKAYRILDADFALPAVRMHLHKMIPSGAGLGGGSSDAAFALSGLNRLFRLDITEERLMAYAARLGSDCAFFIRNRPAFAWGRGELMMTVDLSLEGYELVLVKPEQAVATAKAYAHIKPRPAPCDLRKLAALAVGQWEDVVSNDFEEIVSAFVPEIETIRRKLTEAGALYVSMTGSGSAVYALFDHKINPHDLFPDYFTWSGPGGQGWGP